MSIVRAVCNVMERIAPLRLAEKWDNVGLLLESPQIRQKANRVLLTIDLTPEVTEEALSTPTFYIIAYHPTLFKPLSSLTLSNPLQQTLLRCAAAGISIYSPHTALDSVTNGINDWLAEGCSIYVQDGNKKIYASQTSYIGEPLEGGLGGHGRVVRYATPISVKKVESMVKFWLKLDHIQVAYPCGLNPEEKTVTTVAVGAGSAGSLVAGSGADVWLTGEMSHHEVLAAVASGHTVILCGHTNTERGYLRRLARKLREEIAADGEQEADPAMAQTLESLEVVISEKDKHPLELV
ncbi:NIF3-like protein-like protein [Cytidiella melzeri]|nr:NIF3-like protein-like protein [Cytidiella melzeri]